MSNTSKHFLLELNAPLPLLPFLATIISFFFSCQAVLICSLYLFLPFSASYNFTSTQANSIKTELSSCLLHWPFLVSHPLLFIHQTLTESHNVPSIIQGTDWELETRKWAEWGWQCGRMRHWRLPPFLANINQALNHVNALHGLTHSIPLTAQWVRNCYYPHFHEG